MKHLILTIFGWKTYNSIHELKNVGDFRLRIFPELKCMYAHGRVHYWDLLDKRWKQHSVNFVPYQKGYYKPIPE